MEVMADTNTQPPQLLLQRMIQHLFLIELNIKTQLHNMEQISNLIQMKDWTKVSLPTPTLKSECKNEQLSKQGDLTMK